MSAKPSPGPMAGFVIMPEVPPYTVLRHMAGATFMHDGSTIEMARRWNGALEGLSRCRSLRQGIAQLENRVNAHDRLVEELRDVLEWALTERAPLRQQEIDSIGIALSIATGRSA